MRAPAVVALDLRNARARVRALKVELRDARLAELATRLGMRRARENGLSIEAIAKQFRRNHQTVSRIAREEGWPKCKGGPKRKVVAVRRLRGQDRSHYEKMRGILNMPTDAALAMATAAHHAAQASA